MQQTDNFCKTSEEEREVLSEEQLKRIYHPNRQIRSPLQNSWRVRAGEDEGIAEQQWSSVSSTTGRRRPAGPQQPL